MDNETAAAISAISARMAALELGLAAVAQSRSIDHVSALHEFDLLADAMIGRYLASAVSEQHLELLRTSLGDVRKLLEAPQ